MVAAVVVVDSRGWSLSVGGWDGYECVGNRVKRREERWMEAVL